MSFEDITTAAAAYSDSMKNYKRVYIREKSDFEILLEAMNKKKSGEKTQTVRESSFVLPIPESTGGVTFELSYQAKAALLDEYIEKTLKKGEPLKGVTKEEFNECYYRKTGNHLFGEKLDTYYRVAVKGYNNEAS